MAIASRWLHFAPVFTSSSRVAGSRYLYIAGSLLCSLSFGFPFDKLKCGWLMPPAGTSQRGCCRPGWQRCSQRRALEETEGRRERERERERERGVRTARVGWKCEYLSLSGQTMLLTGRAARAVLCWVDSSFVSALLYVHRDRDRYGLLEPERRAGVASFQCSFTSTETETRTDY